MEALLLEYLPILIFIGLAAVLGGALIVIPLIVAPNPSRTRKSFRLRMRFQCLRRCAHEVRRPVLSRRHPVHHFRSGSGVPVSLGHHPDRAEGGNAVFGFWSMMAFLGVLTVGFIYEWKKGALEWE
jgi:NADH-quinone oxidoreductase subunit A